MRRSPLRALLFALLLGTATVAGCSSDTTDKAKDTAESAADDAAAAADEVSARGQAEALRASLKANGTADENGIRSMEAINQAVADLPGEPTVTGITDDDGDGQDDDGKLQVTVDDSTACLSLPASGENTKVTDGDC